MKYEGISTQLSEALKNATSEQLRKVNKALVDSAIEMRDKARKAFIANGKGYKLQSLEDGIMIGKFRKDMDGSSISIHAFGDTHHRKSYKTRFFVGGAYHRVNKRGKNRGSIESLDTISKSLDQKILDDNIKSVIK